MRRRIRPLGGALIGLLVTSALVASGAASAAAWSGSAADTAAMSSNASIPRVGCAATASKGTAFRSAPASSLHTYDDFIGDAKTAPDICQQNVVTNDNVSITFGMHIHDRSGFSAGDGYTIYLDTDMNPATGSLAGPGVPAGAEFAIDVLDGASNLRHWNGTSFEPVTPAEPIVTEWIEGYGPALQIAPADLGGPQGFNLVLVTTNGEDHDLGPDAGSWSYTLSPLALQAGRLALGPATAGKPFTARMVVVRSDFDDSLDEGAIACAARVGAKALAGGGSFAGGRVGCTWRLPKNARGTRLAGSVAVTFQGVTTKRSFSVRVR